MTSLADLEAQFLCYEPKDGHIYHVPVPTFGAAQGVIFLCPKCFATNNGPIGTHKVICWSRSRGVPDSASPGPGRWVMAGTGLHDLTLNADPPSTGRSIALRGGCEWHGFITNGEAA